MFIVVDVRCILPVFLVRVDDCILNGEVADFLCTILLAVRVVIGVGANAAAVVAMASRHSNENFVISVVDCWCNIII